MVEVTDDWFPKSLQNGSNLTSTVFAFVYPHNHTISPDILLFSAIDELNKVQPNTKFNIIQTPMEPKIITQEKLKHKWILAIIIIAILLVIIAICVVIWAWKNMQKMKKKAQMDTTTTTGGLYKQQEKTMQSSILSTPDAMMIADTFRQVMSTSDLDQSRNQVGKDLLNRQLMSEGTLLSQVERRTSSTK
ncbi:hypothetical protein INT47_013121 [Mucor saturninus]|uniref:Uncharacterized protein n=1 Tax=Mucor saturninus TaxID=64648 RepID=A0A8H7V0E4_9FUNG|nr:hypothetical protein INT47_013121 [Mucor saturninus]